MIDSSSVWHIALMSLLLRSMPQASSSASVRCMIIPDLQWKIFQLVHDTFTERSRNQTLLALALTCKLFTGLALDFLWQDLSGIAPLIKCLPSNLWKYVKGNLEFQRTMTIDDWSIFCRYNHRVRSLKTSANTLGAGTWRTLNCPPFSLPLLPNLVSLVWGAITSENFTFIRLFLTSKLTTLNISRKITFGLSEQSILLCIPMLCPSVSNFSIHRAIESGEISTALQYWPHLSSVRTGEISEVAILYLSNLTSLRSLKFRLPSTFLFASTQTRMQQPAFCALQELAIESKTLEVLDAFFETLFVAPEMLSFTVTEQISAPLALASLISCLPNTCAHSSLQQVHFNIDDGSFDDSDPIEIASFQPLSVFRNLRKLSFQTEYYLQLDDTALLQMVKAWPLLEELHFEKSRIRHHITSNTFVSLLQHCPCLVSVGIAVNWSAVDNHGISLDVPYHGFAHKMLSHASFSNSKIRHPTRIAAFISAIAPNIKSVKAWGMAIYEHDRGFVKYCSRWDLVQDLIKSFSMVREQGRRMVLLAGEESDEEADVGDASGGEEDSEEDTDEYSDRTSSDWEEE
ncbi:uncharacterized protein EDB93DRAFT_1221751 [Suillus bovinus]|uniref:uncharacterized protein n=1 Tax=Suillus bovinus TaxID=48563 RepID=UPI001B86C095|nr:uncharacterized protein EDB93DRAFT_1221751 [Suillus bovinus]KAG2156604.1 hypothetical protein EDB93DRAFT_1221751 [Suillus bovinus]